MRRIFLGVLLAGSIAAADLDTNTVTVTASRPATIQPDQVLLYVSLTTAPDTGLDDVLAKLKPAGITVANLTGVGSLSQWFNTTTTSSTWSFLIPVPFSKMKDTVAALTQLQTSLGSVQGSQALTFSVTGTQISDDARAAQPCPLTALVSDARKQADAMAAAAGMRTGAILSLSDTPSAPTSAARVYDPLTGAPTLGYFLVGISSTIVTSPQPSCSLTVQFQLVP